MRIRDPVHDRQRSPRALGRSSLWLGLGLGLIAGIVGAAIGSQPRTADAPGVAPPVVAGDPLAADPSASVADSIGSTTRTEASADALRRTAIVQAVERVAPAVVSITTEVPVNDPFARMRGAPARTSAQGSGIVIESDGLVLTNAHVISRASRIVASFADGSSYDAEVLGLAEELDLAVLQLRDARGLSAVEVGTSSDLMLGEPVIVIGNPFGLGHTVTTGVISATRRPLETDERVYQDFLQTDASINPGNSGGPLLDIHGRLIGITTAIRPDAEGIGFAIPVDRAIKIAHDLSDYGRVRSPWLGVDLDDVYIQSRGTPPSSTRGGQTAARVVRVHDLGNAAGASLRAGDVIVAIDGRPVQGRGDLNAYLAAFEPGRTVALTVQRPAGDRYRELEVRMAAQGLPDSVVERSLAQVLGVALEDSARAPGVLVSSVSSTGAYARIGGRAGDLLVAINGRPVRTIEELRAVVAATKSAHRTDALVTIRRGSASGRITLPL